MTDKPDDYISNLSMVGKLAVELWHMDQLERVDHLMQMEEADPIAYMLVKAAMSSSYEDVVLGKDKGELQCLRNEVI